MPEPTQSEQYNLKFLDALVSEVRIECWMQDRGYKTHMDTPSITRTDNGDVFFWDEDDEYRRIEVRHMMGWKNPAPYRPKCGFPHSQLMIGPKAATDKGTNIFLMCYVSRDLTHVGQVWPTPEVRAKWRVKPQRQKITGAVVDQYMMPAISALWAPIGDPEEERIEKRVNELRRQGKFPEIVLALGEG